MVKVDESIGRLSELASIYLSSDVAMLSMVA